jgi:hypothetical protein
MGELSVVPYGGTPFTITLTPRHSLKAGRVRFRPYRVRQVLRRCRYAQIQPAIIRSIEIRMINLADRPVARLI